MATIQLSERHHAEIRFAARAFGVSESEVVARAVRELSRAQPPARGERDPWTPIPVYGEYDGRRVDGLYLPATRRVTVTSEPLAGTSFKSPSGAARAVVAALNPERHASQTNGWLWWHLAESAERLEVLR